MGWYRSCPLISHEYNCATLKCHAGISYLDKKPDDGCRANVLVRQDDGEMRGWSRRTIEILASDLVASKTSHPGAATEATQTAATRWCVRVLRPMPCPVTCGLVPTNPASLVRGPQDPVKCKAPDPERFCSSRPVSLLPPGAGQLSVPGPGTNIDLPY